MLQCDHEVRITEEGCLLATHAGALGVQLQMMSLDTFEQLAVPAHLFGSAAAFLSPDFTVTLNSTEDGRIISGASCSSAQDHTSSWQPDSTILGPLCLKSV
jgi:hypothetical protein